MKSIDELVKLKRQVELLNAELDAVYSQIETSWRTGRLATITREYMIADIEDLIQNSKDESKESLLQELTFILAEAKE